MNTQDDTRIKQLFEQLRGEDETSVPSLDEILERPVVASSSPGIFFLRHRLVFGVFALMLIAAPVLYLLQRETVPTQSEQQIGVYEWESPTAFLLDQTEESAWNSIPTIDLKESPWEVDETNSPSSD